MPKHHDTVLPQTPGRVFKISLPGETRPSRQDHDPGNNKKNRM